MIVHLFECVGVFMFAFLGIFFITAIILGLMASENARKNKETMLGLAVFILLIISSLLTTGIYILLTP